MIDKKEFERRKSNIIDILIRNNLNAALVYYDELNIGNGWYLSGWCPQFESGSILLAENGCIYILGGPESEPFAKMDSTIKETKNIPVFMVPEEEYPYAVITSFKGVFNEIFKNKKISRIGIVGINSMPLGIYNRIKSELKRIKLIDITYDYENLRVVKSDYEIDLIKKSFEIADKGFKEIIKNAKEGVTENFLAALAEGKMRSLGANWFGFKTIVATGERSNGVVPTATERKLINGEILLAGVSAKYEGYCSAAGCSLFIGGRPSSEQKNYIKLVSEAYVMTRDMLKPGMVGKENYRKIKEYFSDKGGYYRYIVCPFMHTIGLHEAEAPFFGPNSNDVLKENMTVCIDVSLFGHKTLNGVRVETGFKITKNGYIPLSPYMDNLIESQLDI